MALNKEKLLAELSPNTHKHWQVFCFERLDSTNRWLMEQAEFEDVHGYVCVADSQTAGVGRGGKSWLAPDAKNVLMSVAYQFDMELSQLTSLSLVTGIALVNVLEDLGVLNLAVKWPNDVYLDDAKLAGILIQTQKAKNGGYIAVVGIGLNIELDQQCKLEIAQPVAQLADYGFSVQERELITARILDQLLTCFNQFADGGLASFIDRWNQIDYLKNQYVVLYQAEQQIRGRYVGINNEGALMIEAPDQQKKAYYFGELELSVRRESNL